MFLKEVLVSGLGYLRRLDTNFLRQNLTFVVAAKYSYNSTEEGQDLPFHHLIRSVDTWEKFSSFSNLHGKCEKSY